ncbi:hypothetical protein HDU76_012383 [Blyttiomyces sp. JEL0837]|nr:hypothetical protein HDU76_012383 [Blyttiomyces sp. JEL0837]
MTPNSQPRPRREVPRNPTQGSETPGPRQPPLTEDAQTDTAVIVPQKPILTLTELKEKYARRFQWKLDKFPSGGISAVRMKQIESLKWLIDYIAENEGLDEPHRAKELMSYYTPKQLLDSLDLIRKFAPADISRAVGPLSSKVRHQCDNMYLTSVFPTLKSYADSIEQMYKFEEELLKTERKSIYLFGLQSQSPGTKAYPIWVWQTQFEAANKNGILNDGKFAPPKPRKPEVPISDRQKAREVLRNRPHHFNDLAGFIVSQLSSINNSELESTASSNPAVSSKASGSNTKTIVPAALSQHDAITITQAANTTAPHRQRQHTEEIPPSMLIKSTTPTSVTPHAIDASPQLPETEMFHDDPMDTSETPVSELPSNNKNDSNKRRRKHFVSSASTSATVLFDVQMDDDHDGVSAVAVSDGINYTSSSSGSLKRKNREPDEGEDK